MRVIACDFDDTLAVGLWPSPVIGPPIQSTIDSLLRRQLEGDKIILWTCREGPKLEQAVEWCKEHGIFFDAINDNIPEMKFAMGVNSRKILADEYWDDKAIRPEELK